MEFRTRQEVKAWNKVMAAKEDKSIKVTMNDVALVERVVHRTWKAMEPKRVVEELPCADLEGAKMFAEVYGFKYEVKQKDGGAVYYMNADDINKKASSRSCFDRLSEDAYAVAIKQDRGFVLRMVRFER